MEQNDKQLDLRRLWRAIRELKWIYLAAIVLMVGAASYISFRGLTKYDIEGSLLIGESETDTNVKSGGMAQMLKTFSVGGFGASSVDNEVLILQSHDVTMRTVRSLDLNRKYIGKDSDGTKALLYKDTPVRIEAPAEYFDSLSVTLQFEIELLENGNADIKIFRKRFLRKTTLREMNNVQLPYFAETAYGNFQIMPTDLLESSPFRKIRVIVSGNDKVTDQLCKELTIDVASKLSDIINVELTYSNKDLGKAIVDGVMTEYNSKRIDRLHELSLASIEYYDGRIAETFNELEKAERAVTEYQRNNDLMGIDSELKLLVGAAVDGKQSIMTANYNIAYYQTVLDILRNRLNDDVIIPQMESLNDPHIGEFNAAIQTRRDLKRSATDDNTAIILLNERINGLRDIIIENSEKMIAKARADVRHQQDLTDNAQNRLHKYPDYELEFRQLMRDKEFRSTLYSYLIQQRENAVLQLYSNKNIGFIFQPAYVVKTVSALKRLVLPLIALILALIGVTSLAVIKMILSRKVTQPCDLAFIGIDRHSINANSPDAINHLRTMFLNNPDINTIYVADLTSGNDSTGAKLTKSLTDTCRTVTTIDDIATNGSILSPEFAERLKSERLSSDYLVIQVPESTDVFELEPVIDRNDSALLVIIPSTMSRSEIKRILKGQTVSHVYTVIV